MLIAGVQFRCSPRSLGPEDTRASRTRVAAASRLGGVEPDCCQGGSSGNGSPMEVVRSRFPGGTENEVLGPVFTVTARATLHRPIADRWRCSPTPG